MEAICVGSRNACLPLIFRWKSNISHDWRVFYVQSQRRSPYISYIQRLYRVSDMKNAEIT